MKVKIICVGKLKEKFLVDACKEYIKRSTPYAKIEVCELSEYRLPQDPSEAEIQAGIEKEGKAMGEKISARAAVVALCVEGEMLSSERFSEQISSFMGNGFSEICFLIGGSFGLADELKKRADLCLSFSRMTFPHQLMRVILLEQLYRAFQIANGGKYHK